MDRRDENKDMREIAEEVERTTDDTTSMQPTGPDQRTATEMQPTGPDERKSTEMHPADD